MSESFFSPEANEKKIRTLEESWEQDKTLGNFITLAHEYARNGMEEEKEGLLEEAFDQFSELFSLRSKPWEARMIHPDEFERLSPDLKQVLLNAFDYLVYFNDFEAFIRFSETHKNIPVDLLLSGDRWSSFSDQIPKQVRGISLRDFSEENFLNFIKDEKIAQFDRVDLRDNQIGDEGVQALAESEHVSNWRTVNLMSNGIGPAGAKVLAESEHVSNWRNVGLGRNEIGDAGAKALAESEYVSNWRTVDLGRNQIGDEGVQALAESEHVSNWRTVILLHNGIGDAGQQALDGSPNVTGDWRY